MEVSIKVANDLVMNPKEVTRFLFGCFSMSTIFANLLVEVQGYRYMDNWYHSH